MDFGGRRGEAVGWEVGSRKRDEEQEGTKDVCESGIAGKGRTYERGKMVGSGGGGRVRGEALGWRLDALLWDAEGRSKRISGE
jgi:hypothetical protein